MPSVWPMQRVEQRAPRGPFVDRGRSNGVSLRSRLWLVGALLTLVTTPAMATAATVTEFRLPDTTYEGVAAGGPAHITTGPDGNLWFTEGAGRIGRITPRGAVTEFAAGISPDSEPHGITLGPDGNLWFTEYTGDRIGRITPSGKVTEFPTGIPGPSDLNDIAAGADGNLWFTARTGLGRITPGGAVTEFSVPAALNSPPDGIAAGPDGNIWFTGRSGIGRITPGGTVTEFSVGLPADSYPGEIATGPDGNLWFTESSGIGRITPGGTISDFPVASPLQSQPYGIAAGPDGNIWFTDSDPNVGLIGRMTPRGAVTLFSDGIRATGGPEGIAAGPDGDLWFTEAYAVLIGRIQPPAQPVPLIAKVDNHLLPRLRCVTRRRLRIPLRPFAAHDGNVVRATVTVDGVRVRTVTGFNIRVVTIPIRARGRSTVKVVAVTTKHFQLTATRTYRACGLHEPVS